MEFIYYDLAFLVAVSLIVGLFLYKNRKKLQIESKILLLYRTSFGLDFIERTSKRSPAIFRILAALSIFSGYLLMAGGIFLLVETLRLIWTSAIIPKIPPLMPLVPYLPSLFKIEFLPPFYFTYWIISIAIVAVGHEFMHGVFARFYGVKLKSTGFGFLGPFLAAFVEPDEKKMEKKPASEQMAILSGGSFANLIMAIIFFIAINIFFAAAFMQAGVIIPQLNVNGTIVPSYMLAAANSSNATYNGHAVNLTDLSIENKTEYRIEISNQSYYLTKEILDVTPKNSSVLIVYADTPAYKLKINGTIQKVNGIETRNYEEFASSLSGMKPGQNISLQTSEGNWTFSLGTDPENSSRGVIGIGFPQDEKRSPLVGLIQKFIAKRELLTYYAPKSDLSIFIYNLLLWIVLINVSVMLVNMLPFSIFDGGKFFYLSILKITGSKKKALKGFKAANTIILLLLAALMIIWFVRAF